ncbi:hypothetical protein [Burkholderia oklahomensis]|uniref:hypothetical protein n=1 Tax=Burkholderia oklahomensis TaxID=342113 RepID=UPI001E55263E|nr:hypothetical protein [Burkholderia oklahomensis]MDN7671417.1 hypothetical protein [Burkholderia oklahomensis]
MTALEVHARLRRAPGVDVGRADRRLRGSAAVSAGRVRVAEDRIDAGVLAEQVIGAEPGLAIAGRRIARRLRLAVADLRLQRRRGQPTPNTGAFRYASVRRNVEPASAARRESL